MLRRKCDKAGWNFCILHILISTRYSFYCRMLYQYVAKLGKTLELRVLLVWFFFPINTVPGAILY